MTSLNAVDAVRQFLNRNNNQAFLLSEVAAAVRSQVPSEPDVANAVQELAAKGEVISRAFPVSDPHLAFNSLEFLAAIDSKGDVRAAELLTQKAYQSWLSDWLSSHRCT